ncbi:MAG: SpoIIE family protein phosphatase [Spirochaetales bacterium]|nr:SpoIIE family protein phosphatase [Spirochaetales bacterium]
MKNEGIKWYRSLTFLALTGITLVPLWALGGIVLIMNTLGEDLVVEESSRLIEELGNTAITEIGTRSSQIEALTRSLALLGEGIPRDPNLARTVLPGLINFHSDLDVAGGGIWPEPFTFTPGVEKRSFFYGRNQEGKLEYYDDYNTGRGYFKDEWYPVVKYSQSGKCFWSKSYMDPYSYQPMVTCTVAMRNGKEFRGVATIDLRLEGLHDFMERIRQKTGGYVFLLDRNNKFLTFPEPDKVRLTGTDDKGKTTQEFITAQELGKREPLFLPIAQAVESMNEEILSRARAMPGFRADIASKLTVDSDQINAEEAAMIAAVIADPIGSEKKNTNLFRKITIPDDFLIQEESLVFLFNVPDSYWKVVAVKPVREARAVAAAISRLIIVLMSITILGGVILAAFLLHVFFNRPIRATTRAVEELGSLVAERKFQQLSEHRIPEQNQDELGYLARVMNSLSSELETSYKSLLELNASLEQKVIERTQELQNTLEAVRSLKFQQDGDYYLTSLLINPLSGNFARSDYCKIDFLVRQKKQFEFRHWKEEIGGDMCTSHSIQLQGRACTVIVNADAMGKSMQGAGGILVLGSIFNATIARTRLSHVIQKQSPERWLKNAFIELQKVFESFNGSMLISLVLALIDDESGVLYFINAEHPDLVLLRGGKARFLTPQQQFKKIGVVWSGFNSLQVQVFPLENRDIVIFGSDGRDDIAIGAGEDGNRMINEDETLFLRIVEDSGGDLTQILSSIEKHGVLTDDLSLARLEYASTAPALENSTIQSIKEARALLAKEEPAHALEILSPLLTAGDSHPLLWKYMADAEFKLGEYAHAAELARLYVESAPADTSFLLRASYYFSKNGDIIQAIDLAERYRMRRPDDLRILQSLARLYRKSGNEERASELLATLSAT